MDEEFDLDHLIIDEEKDYSQQVLEQESQYEVDNDCGDACKL
ncbi:hypothetical protein [Brackiella oedipodis]|nr:hypothetical protein [Brackiella oedipodis]